MRIVLILTAICSTLFATAQDDVVKKGDAMPQFSFMSDNGHELNFSSLKQKVVLINFFATWCGPCLAELPVLQKKIWEKYRNNKNFSLLVIGRGHSDEDIKAFKDKYHFDLPFYPDRDKHIYSLFATKYIPRNYIIDKEGKIVYLSMGYEEHEFEKMAAILDEMLK